MNKILVCIVVYWLHFHMLDIQLFLLLMARTSIECE
jgi:hypothetical protein